MGKQINMEDIEANKKERKRKGRMETWHRDKRHEGDGVCDRVTYPSSATLPHTDARERGLL